MSTSPSSLSNKYSRYVHGGSTETNSIGLGWWERKIIPKDETDIVYHVENKYEHRLDLISAIFYGESRYWWVIAQYNNVLDPHGEIVAGRILLIPTKTRLTTNILTGRI
jgi:hypothetical protein